MIELTIPCSYQGGKQRLASQIVDIIFSENNILNDDTTFYDLCSGTGAISIELVNRGIKPQQITMIDKSPFTLFYKSIGEGRFDLEKFKRYIDNLPSKEKIKSHMEKLIKQDCYVDTEYKYILLQSASFGAKAIWIDETNKKWCTSSFRNYWLPTETSSRRSPVNPMMPMPNTLYERVVNLTKSLYGINAINSDINNIKIKDKSIIYIDPPYDETSKYGYEFDYISFIKEYKSNNIIYLSEGKKLSDKAYLLSKGRSKGGISGDRKKKANEEWLNVF